MLLYIFTFIVVIVFFMVCQSTLFIAYKNTKLCCSYCYMHLLLFTYLHKAPHQCVVDAAAHLGICGMALKWISSFITGRTQQVKVGESLSCTSDVISGVIQGSILGPVLFIMLKNSLLHLIKLPLGGFADDLKFALSTVSLKYSKRSISLPPGLVPISCRSPQRRVL